MTTLMTADININASKLTDKAIAAFKAQLDTQTIITAKLAIVTASGEVVELDVNEILKMDWIAIELETGIEIETADYLY